MSVQDAILWANSKSFNDGGNDASPIMRALERRSQLIAERRSIARERHLAIQRDLSLKALLFSRVRGRTEGAASTDRWPFEDRRPKIAFEQRVEHDVESASRDSGVRPPRLDDNLLAELRELPDRLAELDRAVQDATSALIGLEADVMEHVPESPGDGLLKLMFLIESLSDEARPDDLAIAAVLVECLHAMGIGT